VSQLVSFLGSRGEKKKRALSRHWGKNLIGSGEFELASEGWFGTLFLWGKGRGFPPFVWVHGTSGEERGKEKRGQFLIKRGGKG